MPHAAKSEIFLLSREIRKMKRIKTLLIMLLAVSIVACNTVRGVGRDIERTGEVIQGAGK